MTPAGKSGRRKNAEIGNHQEVLKKRGRVCPAPLSNGGGALVQVLLHAFLAVFMIFCLMAVGYVLGLLGWLTSSEKKFLSRYVINIAVPMNAVVGMLNNVGHDQLVKLGWMFCVPLIGISVCLLFSTAAARILRLPKKRQGIFTAMAFLSNTLFIGLPLSTELFGEEAVPYVMVYYFGSSIYTQTAAVLLMEHAGDAAPEVHTPGQFLKDIFTKPPILGCITAVLLLVFDLHPPVLFMHFAEYLSATLTPLALMYSGFVIYELGIRNIRFEKGILPMLVFRLIVSPLICWGFCRIFGVTGLAEKVFIVEAALPVVTQITVMAGVYGADEKYAADGTILSTLGIFITIPLLMLLLG